MPVWTTDPVIKEPTRSSISGVIIIYYRHHHHSGCLPPSSGCLSKHQSFSSHSNCSRVLPSPRSLLSSSKRSLNLLLGSPFRNSLPHLRRAGGIFITAITGAVIVAIAVVFTSLPPAETRTSNTQQVHYSSHSIISPTLNQAVSHT